MSKSRKEEAKEQFVAKKSELPSLRIKDYDRWVSRLAMLVQIYIGKDTPLYQSALNLKFRKTYPTTFTPQQKTVHKKYEKDSAEGLINECLEHIEKIGVLPKLNWVYTIRDEYAVGGSVFLLGVVFTLGVMVQSVFYSEPALEKAVNSLNEKIETSEKRIGVLRDSVDLLNSLIENPPDKSPKTKPYKKD
jgi:hypothetical protein